MRSFRYIIAANIILCVSAQVKAGTLIDVGSHALLPDMPGQIVELFAEVDPPNSGADQVTGFNLRAQIGDGMGPIVEPVFTDIDFSNAIWDAHEFEVTGDGPVEMAPQFAQTSVVFTQSQLSVPASGKIATLVIDTTGIGLGSFDLRLTDTEIGVPSDFLAVDVGVQVPFVPRIVNGTLEIVPEPSGLLTLAVGWLMLLGRRGWRR